MITCSYKKAGFTIGGSFLFGCIFAYRVIEYVHRKKVLENNNAEDYEHNNDDICSTEGETSSSSSFEEEERDVADDDGNSLSNECVKKRGAGVTGKKRSKNRRKNHRHNRHHRQRNSAYLSSTISNGFLSDIIRQLWNHINIGLSDSFVAEVEPMFESYLPSPMKKMRFVKCHFGTNPVQFEHIIVHDVSDDGTSLQIDLDVFWDAQNCDIQFKAPIVGSFGVNSIQLRGRLQIIIKPLSDELPCFDIFQFSFFNLPYIDFKYTGAALTFPGISLVKSKMRCIIEDSISDMMVLPHRQFCKLDESKSLLDAYQPPIGIARLTLLRGRHLSNKYGKGNKTLVGLLPSSTVKPNVFCQISLGKKSWISSTVYQSSNPNWIYQVADFVLYDYEQMITLKLYNEDKNNSTNKFGDCLGECQVTVGEILLAGKEMDLELSSHNMLPAQKQKQPQQTQTQSTVSLRCEICPLTSNLSTLLPTQNHKQEYVNEHQMTGLLTIIVNRAFDIPLPENDRATFVRVTYKENSYVTYTIVDTSNPIYDFFVDIPIFFHKNNNESDNTTGTSSFNGDIKFQLFQCNLKKKNEAKNNSKDASMKKLPDESLLGFVLVSCDEVFDSNDEKIFTNTQEVGFENASIEFSIKIRGIAAKTTNASSSTKKTEQQQQIVDESTTATLREESKLDNTEENSASISINTDITTSKEKVINIDSASIIQRGPVQNYLNNIGKVRITIHQGWGFKSYKRLFRRALAMPHCFCYIKYGSSRNDQWRTGTIPNTVHPLWEEASPIIAVYNHDQIVYIEARDESKMNTDQDKNEMKSSFANMSTSSNSSSSGFGGGSSSNNRNGNSGINNIILLDKFELLGSSKITMGKLLLSNTNCTTIELEKDNRPTGYYIQLSCDMM